jgi:hypothetical protein
MKQSSKNKAGDSVLLGSVCNIWIYAGIQMKSAGFINTN